MASRDWGSVEWNEDHFPVAQLDDVGDTWGIRWRGMEKMRHRSYLRIIKKNLRSRDRKNILDIGCALCDFSAKAWNVNKANKIWAMDISETAIDWARNNYPEFHLRVGAAPKIPFDIEFDLILFLEVMCYLNESERVQAIENIRDHLTAGGKILFAGVLDGGVQHHTIDEVEELLGRCFEIEKLHFNYWSLHQQYIERPLSLVEDAASRIRQTIAAPEAEYRALAQQVESRSKRAVIKSLYALNPVSAWLLKSISWSARQIVGSTIVAQLFHHMSKLIRGSIDADEIVVLAVAKK